MKTRHPASVYLSEYTEIRARIDSLQETLADLRSMAQRAAPQLFGDRVKTTRKTSRVEDSILRIEETERHILSSIEHLAECLDMRLWLIEQLDDEREKLLLTLRYIQGLSFTKISMKMNYGESQTYLIHQHALDNLWEIHQKGVM